MKGDNKLFHQNPSLTGSLFQVASQFNMLKTNTANPISNTVAVTIHADAATSGHVDDGNSSDATDNNNNGVGGFTAHST